MSEFVKNKSDKVNSDGIFECEDLHIFQNLLGTYSFMGTIPIALGKLQRATKGDIQRGEAAPDKTGALMALKFPSFKTPYEAFMFAKGKGFISLSYQKVSIADKFYSCPVICRDATTDILFNPLDKGQEDRLGHVERLEPSEVERYKELGLERFIFWSVYETGMDSLSSLVGDYREEDEAIEARDEMYRKAMM